MTYLEKNNIEIKEGSYDFDYITEVPYSGASTVSTGVFQWEPKTTKGFKRKKTVVRVSGCVGSIREINEMAANILNQLEQGHWDGRKNVKI